MAKLEETVKKVIKESLATMYGVVDNFPIEKDKFDNYSASLPTLDEMGIIVSLTDSRKIHCMMFDIGNGVRYGSATDGGGDYHVFDFSSYKTNSRIYNRFKSEIEDYFDCPIMDDADVKKRFSTYIEKRFPNKD